jgi:hypothetical protein
LNSAQGVRCSLIAGRVERLRALGTVPGPERQFPAAAALPDGRVLITGGYDNRTYLTATAVVVEP